jgi:hypothetical protein
LAIDTWQRGTFGKTNIEQVPVPHASHRSTFLTAVAGQIEWFNAKRGLPDPVSDLVAMLNGPGTEATLAWSTPATNGLPITGYRVEYKDVTQTKWTELATVAPVPTSATVTGLTPGQRYQYRVFAFTGNGGVGALCPSSNLAVTGNRAPVAEEPVVLPRNPATGEVTGLLTVTDADNDPLRYRVSAWPTKGSVTWTFVTVNDTVDTTRMFFTYTPTAAGDLTDSFTVTVSDGFGGSTDVKIDIEIS